MVSYNFKGKSALITGGAGGLGIAMAARLMQSGARCMLWDIDNKKLKAAVQSLKSAGDCQGWTVDLTQSAEVKKAAEMTLNSIGGIDYLINNAGIAGVSKKLWECSDAEWTSVIQLNLNAVFYVCRAFIPGMMARHSGRIVNIASIAGKEGNPNASHYSASKAGVIGLTKSLGKELARTGIRVNCITPAVIKTDILKQVSQEHVDYMLSKIPMNRFGTPEEAAEMVAWLCSDACSFTTGAVFDLSGGRATY